MRPTEAFQSALYDAMLRSLVTPPSVFDYDVTSRARTLFMLTIVRRAE